MTRDEWFTKHFSVVPVLYRHPSPFAKRADWQPWHSARWYREWETLAKEGQQYKEPRPFFPDAPSTHE
jgi:hypothetical protein